MTTCADFPKPSLVFMQRERNAQMWGLLVMSHNIETTIKDLTSLIGRSK